MVRMQHNEARLIQATQALGTLRDCVDRVERIGGERALTAASRKPYRQARTLLSHIDSQLQGAGYGRDSLEGVWFVLLLVPALFGALVVTLREITAIKVAEPINAEISKAAEIAGTATGWSLAIVIAGFAAAIALPQWRKALGLKSRGRAAAA